MSSWWLGLFCMSLCWMSWSLFNTRVLRNKVTLAENTSFTLIISNFNHFLHIFQSFPFRQKFFFFACHYLNFKVGVSLIKLDCSSIKLDCFMEENNFLFYKNVLLSPHPSGIIYKWLSYIDCWVQCYKKFMAVSYGLNRVNYLVLTPNDTYHNDTQHNVQNFIAQ